MITETDDGHGNIIQTETTQTRTYLYITVSHKTAEEMADQYGFDDEQRQMLSELLADENNSLWSQVLYGISIGDGEIVTVALSQVCGTASTPVSSGALASFRGALMSAVILKTELSQSSQAAYKALNGLWREDNGRTAALRQKQDTLSSLIGKVTVLQTM